MPPGIRATVEFSSSDLCPLVELADSEGSTIDSVSTNVRPSNATKTVAEFSMDGGHVSREDVTRVFSHGAASRYRLVLDDGRGCPCQCLGQFGCPVARYLTRDGTLTLVFHAAEYEELRRIVGELRERFPGMDIKRFVRSPSGEPSGDGVFVDRGRLTARQLEVLETAYEAGYFDRPRETNATEIAGSLDISPSTFREHLAAAESKLLEDVLESGP